MDWAFFAAVIVAISTAGWVFTTYIRARHGYPIDSGGWGFKGDNVGKVSAETDRKVELLATENGQLKDMIVRLEDRIAVLERIATDKSRRLIDEIESLR